MGLFKMKARLALIALVVAGMLAAAAALERSSAMGTLFD